MNVGVEAGPLSVSLKAEMIEIACVKTEINTGTSLVISSWSCFTPAPLSINGHSLNAINPDFNLVGGMATPVLA
jgi:hypothetical protein